jgi:hypothetical protein
VVGWRWKSLGNDLRTRSQKLKYSVANGILFAEFASVRVLYGVSVCRPLPPRSSTRSLDKDSHHRTPLSGFINPLSPPSPSVFPLPVSFSLPSRASQPVAHPTPRLWTACPHFRYRLYDALHRPLENVCPPLSFYPERAVHAVSGQLSIRMDHGARVLPIPITGRAVSWRSRPGNHMPHARVASRARCTMLSVPSPVHTRLCGPGTRPRDPPHPLRALERWIECPLIAHRATLRTGLTQLLGACRHCTWEPHIGHRRADALAAHTQRSPVLPQLTCARSVRLQPGFSSRRGAYVFDGAGRVVWATALALWRCPARCHGGRQLGTQFGYAAGRSYATARHGGRLRPVCVYIRSCALALQAPCVLRCAGRKAESQEPLTRPPADRVGSERLEVGGRNSTCSQWCER